LRTVAQNAAVAIAYLAVAYPALQIDAVGGFATLVWPATGVALVALVLGGMRLWPGIAIGALVTNAWNGAPIAVAAGIAVGNTLEAVASAWLLRRVGFAPALARVRDALSLVGLAVSVGPLISATIGVASLRAGGVIDDATLAITWRSWWLGDVTGDLVVAPLLLVWSAGRPRWRARELVELIGLVAATAAMSLLVFEELLLDLGPFAQAPMIFPFVIWGALRFQQRATTLVTLVACAIAVIGTARGHGPFASETVHGGLFHLAAFLGVVAVTALFLGAAIAEARAAADAREEFLSVASHELRTPLSALVLQLGDLQRVADQDRLRSKVERVARVTDRMVRLVDDLLDVSRIRAHRVELQTDDCDLAELTRDVVDRTAEQARRHGCELNLAASEPVIGRWDRNRLEQVIGNLLSNAIKYGSGKPVEVAVSQGGGTAAVTVRDHGIGVARADQQRIFARFERGVPMQNFGGLGLGLYIAREIVAAHGGAIRVTSEPGQGACFTVELPLAP
jgi:signal transduction histidine kinase